MREGMKKKPSTASVITVLLFNSFLLGIARSPSRRRRGATEWPGCENLPFRECASSSVDLSDRSRVGARGQGVLWMGIPLRGVAPTCLGGTDRNSGRNM